MTPVRPNAQPQQPPVRVPHIGDSTLEAAWPMAFRALLLLSEAAHPGDPLLARLSDDDLVLLRASLTRLASTGGESDPQRFPTSAA